MSSDAAKPINSFVEEQVRTGAWREQTLPTSVTGMPRPLKVYRASRKSKFIKHDWHGTPSSPGKTGSFCPAVWHDLAISSGACSYGCRACFLLLTYRAMRDPMSPLLYENYDDYERAVRLWLKADDWKTEREGTGRVRLNARHSLGLGIDCSDSLLFEGETGHARRLIPLFASAETNPRGNTLVLLTKSANTHYLEGLPTSNVAVTFSLNPEPVADAWEGKYADTLERITPPIRRRLEACRQAEEFGFETRLRIDPILPIPGWVEAYREFFREAASLVSPVATTLGTYREKINQLDLWRERWGLPPMEWEPEGMTKEGSHRHVPADERREVYRAVIRIIEETPWKAKPGIELCKETHELRREVGIKGCSCNCLKLPPAGARSLPVIA